MIVENNDLSLAELRVLGWLLPAGTSGYKRYLDAATSMDVALRTPEMVILGNRDEEIRSVVAAGEFADGTNTHTVSISASDDLSAFMLLAPSDLELTPIWCYSYWQAGEACPATAGEVREIAVGAKYVLAFSAANTSVWLHDRETGFNQLLSITGLFRSLLDEAPRLRTGSSLNKEYFFKAADRSSNGELARALLRYNAQAKKFDASGIIIEDKRERSAGLLGRFLHRIRGGN